MFRRRQLAFTGKVLAGFTDQILNDLESIQASADRLSDLLEQTGPRAEGDQQRFADILSTIERHLKVLGKKNKHLNRYAQRTNTPLSTFDAGELVEEVISFSTRLPACVRFLSKKTWPKNCRFYAVIPSGFISWFRCSSTICWNGWKGGQAHTSCKIGRDGVAH